MRARVQLHLRYVSLTYYQHHRITASSRTAIFDYLDHLKCYMLVVRLRLEQD
jgi:hypothetical protein